MGKYSELLADSRAAASLRRTRSVAGNATERVLGSGPLRRARCLASVAYGESRLATALWRIGQLVRGSRCYRWIVTEQSEQTTVVDLRTAVTATPLVGPGGRILRGIHDGWLTSRVRSLWSFVRHRVSRSPVRLFGAFVLLVGLPEAGLVLVSGSPSTLGVGLRLYVLAIALFATRVDLPWKTLRTARTVRTIRRVFEAPDAGGKPGG